VSDTGGQTQGTCIAVNAEWDWILAETIVFSDGSTLEFQGFGVGAAKESLRTFVGGSGRYLGATGTAVVEPGQDLKLWKRTISVAVP